MMIQKQKKLSKKIFFLTNIIPSPSALFAHQFSRCNSLIKFVLDDALTIWYT